MTRRLCTFIVLLTLTAVTGFGASVRVFGPVTYARGTGKPVTVRKTFRVPDPSGKYVLRVVNQGVTSATISLNGRTILGPKDFTVKHGRPCRDDEWERHRGGPDDGGPADHLPTLAVQASQ